MKTIQMLALFILPFCSLRAQTSTNSDERILYALSREANEEDFPFDYQVQRIVLSQSKDWAYESGSFSGSYDTANGEHIRFKKSYLRVWRKNKGEWQLEEVFNRPQEEKKYAAYYLLGD